MKLKSILLLSLTLLTVFNGFSATFTVTITGGNAQWSAPYTAGSYQKAIQDAIANPGPDEIVFDYTALPNHRAAKINKN